MLRTLSLLLVVVLANPAQGLLSAQQPTARARKTPATPTTLTGRLSDVTHVGLSPQPRGYILHLFTEQQHQANLASIANYRAEVLEYEKQPSVLIQRQESTRLDALRRQGRRVTLTTAEADAREAIPEPKPPFATTISLKQVVHVGVDYIEVQASPAADSTTLIPFARLYKIVAHKEPGRSSPESEAIVPRAR